MGWRVNTMLQGALTVVTLAWAWLTPEVWVPATVLGLILAVGLLGAYAQRQRRGRVQAAFEQLIDDARFEPIEDTDRRQVLGQYVHELLTGERVPPEHAAPLAHAVAYRTDGLTLNVVHVAHEQRTAGVTEPDSLVVVCDGFDVTLPEFRLLPSNALLRQTVGQGVYPRDTSFGRYNLVFTRQPKRVDRVLDDEAKALLDRNDTIAIECTADRIVLYRHDHKGQPDGLMPFVEDCLTLAQIVRENARDDGDVSA